MPGANPDCVFCKIVAGEIPALKLLETDQALAFLDIGPLADGHLLLIPKQHFATLSDMPPESVSELTRHLPKLARALQDVAGVGNYNILQNNGRPAGQEVDHVHFHVIPRREGDGLGYRWHPKKYEPGRGEKLREQLVKALDSII